MSIPPPTHSDELNRLFTEACIAQTEGRLAEAMDNYLLAQNRTNMTRQH